MAKMTIEFDMDAGVDPTQLFEEMQSHLNEYIAGTWGPDADGGYEGPYIYDVAVEWEAKDMDTADLVNILLDRGLFVLVLDARDITGNFYNAEEFESDQERVNDWLAHNEDALTDRMVDTFYEYKAEHPLKEV